ncbi:MAG TPA: DUF6799 domain-containing protein [Verrucomicrobiae bacterium]|jgi:hypothetical protein
MKTNRLFSLILALAASVAVRSSFAQDAGAIDRVTVKDGKLSALQAGQLVAVTEAVKFPGDLTVNTNATYQIGEGKPREFKEGQTLSKDGTMLEADGTTYPVYDHVTLNRGRVLVMRDGEYSPVSGQLALGDGSRVGSDGVVTGKDGSPRRLLDGQILRLDGTAAPAKDTVSLFKGKVSVQKDGSKIDVAAGRTITMNDGTKVFGEGYVIKSDGTRVNLSEGQTLEVEGVATRR